MVISKISSLKNMLLAMYRDGVLDRDVYQETMKNLQQTDQMLRSYAEDEEKHYVRLGGSFDKSRKGIVVDARL